MKISKRALNYLKMINKTDEKSMTLLKGYAKLADELIKAELAVLIHKARGGCNVALTQKGVDHEALSDGDSV